MPTFGCSVLLTVATSETYQLLCIQSTIIVLALLLVSCLSVSAHVTALFAFSVQQLSVLCALKTTSKPSRRKRYVGGGGALISPMWMLNPGHLCKGLSASCGLCQ